MAVAAGGAMGSVARHAVNVSFTHLFGRPVPYATAAVNVIGSAVIGVLAGLIASGRLTLSTNLRVFIFVGLLGGFTTFSTFMLDTIALTHAGARTLALSNVAGQIILGMAAVYAGYHVGAR